MKAVKCLSAVVIALVMLGFGTSVYGQGPEMRWQPSSGGYPVDNHQGEPGVPSEITIDGVMPGWVRVTLELDLSDWGTGVGSPALQSYQATIDAATGYASGDGDDLLPVGGFPGGLPYCRIDLVHPRFVFRGVSPPCPFLPLGSATSPNCQLGVSIAPCSVPDPVTNEYGGEVPVDVPPGAAGTYDIPFVPSQHFTFMTDSSGNYFVPLTLTPVRITVPMGKCCYNLGPSVQCVDGISETQCDALPGLHLFTAGDTCDPGDPNDCPNCQTDADCFEGGACQEGRCGMVWDGGGWVPGAPGDCGYRLLYDAAVYCCNPITGGLIPIDDGNECSDDDCNEATGEVTHTNDDTNACSHENLCVINDHCDAGVCAGDLPEDLDIFCLEDLDCPVGWFCDIPNHTCDCAAGDCDGDGVPDPCELDCSDFGGECNMPGCGEEDDCNVNRIPDDCDIADGTSEDWNVNGVPDECELDVEIQLLVRGAAGDEDRTDTLPYSEPSVAAGTEFVVEVWATVSGVEADGLVAVYVDLTFDPGLVNGQNIEIGHGGLFTLAARGEVEGDTIINLGGIASDGTGILCVGVEPEWVRVAVITFEALETLAPAAFGSAHNDLLGIGACGWGEVSAQRVAYGTASVPITCVYNYDGSDDGLINANDGIGLFDLCMGVCGPVWEGNTACARLDFDCSGCMVAGDIGWFAAGWMKYCNQLTDEDLPPCHRNGKAARSGRLPQGGAVASGVVSRSDGLGESLRSGSLANNVLIRWETVAVARGQDGWPKPSRRDIGYRAGDQFDVELWTRDDTANSRGLTAVYVDLAFDPTEVLVNQIDHGSTYTMVVSGEIGAQSINRLGGANLDPGVAVGAWTQFATVRMTARVDLPRGPKLKVQPAYDGVAGLGRGTIPDDQIRVIGTQDFSAYEKQPRRQSEGGADRFEAVRQSKPQS